MGRARPRASRAACDVLPPPASLPAAAPPGRPPLTIGPLCGAPPNSRRAPPTRVTECSPRAEGTPADVSGLTGRRASVGGDVEVSKVIMWSEVRWVWM